MRAREQSGDVGFAGYGARHLLGALRHGSMNGFRGQNVVRGTREWVAPRVLDAVRGSPSGVLEQELEQVLDS